MPSKCLILFLSSTEAQAAAALVRSRGIKCDVIRPPASLTGGSCCYALSFDSRALRRVRSVVGTGGGIACRGENGWNRL